jgi:adenylyl-sulfate kinase
LEKQSEKPGAGFVVWFTGLSGAGKSTLSHRLADELVRRGVHVELLDGDEVRETLSKGLGFSKEDRDTNIRRIGFVARIVARCGACAIVAAISPYRAVREEIRAAAPRFFEIHCDCPLEVLAERDPKGLYRRAMAGQIKNFTGVDDPYEPPAAPEVHVRTDQEDADTSLVRILSRLEELGFIARQ